MGIVDTVVFIVAVCTIVYLLVEAVVKELL